MTFVRTLVAPLLTACLSVGCNVTIPKRSPPAGTSNPTAAAAPSSGANVTAEVAAVNTSAPSAAPSSQAIVKEDQVFRVPVGPAFLILPGEGLGPIRFGASLATIERLMEAECTEITEEKGMQWCRYQANAVDFGLRNNELVEIHVHGVEREFVPGKGLGVDNSYGVFRGTFMNKAQLGMFPKWVDQGKPRRVQKLKPGRFPTVEKHYYPNMVLEYDQLKNGNVVLGGVVLTKPKGGKVRKRQAQRAKSSESRPYTDDTPVAPRASPGAW